MGVLPLEFKPGTTRLTLGIDGTETFDVIGERTPRADLTLVIHRRDGQDVIVPVTCRLDSDSGDLRGGWRAAALLPRISWKAPRWHPTARQRAVFLCKEHIHDLPPATPYSRHLHARRHQQGRVLPPAGPAEAAQVPGAARDAR